MERSNSFNPTDPPRKRKRQRPIISCVECHRRKQKCDRQEPCGNCTLRSASHLCKYETTPAATTTTNRTQKPHAPSTERSLSSDGDYDAESCTDVGSSYGYASGVRSNTAVEVLERLNLDGDAWGADGTFDVPSAISKQDYHRIISLIPPRPYTLQLCQVFMAECSWMYAVINPALFYSLLDEWYFSLRSPPSAISPARRREISQFPALLLQVMAVALQTLPAEHHQQISQLTLGSTDFRALSTAYSEAAVELAGKLSSTHATLPRIQAWFWRASWLKSDGRAVESWHALGQAVREAQELGLHKERPLPRQNHLSTPTQLNLSLWQRETEKRVWAILYGWDRFMAVVLGRPTMINDAHCTISLPIDCNFPSTISDASKLAPTPRSPSDPPCEFTWRLYDYQLAHIVTEIETLQLRFPASPAPSNFDALDQIQAKIIRVTESFPPQFSMTNRDTTHDASVPFLSAMAQLLKSTSLLLIIGLHRPFVFTRRISRNEITAATLTILEAQEEIYRATREHHHSIYTMNFYTFDPAVLLAGITITGACGMSREERQRALVCLKRGKERLEKLGDRVELARRGSRVLRLLERRAKEAVERIEIVEWNQGVEGGGDSEESPGHASTSSGDSSDIGSASTTTDDSVRGPPSTKQPSLHIDNFIHHSQPAAPSEYTHSIRLHSIPDVTATNEPGLEHTGYEIPPTDLAFNLDDPIPLLPDLDSQQALFQQQIENGWAIPREEDEQFWVGLLGEI